MLRTERLYAARIGTKVGNYRFDAPAQVVDVRLVRAGVDHSLLGAISTGRKVGHHSSPEELITIMYMPQQDRPVNLTYAPLCHLVNKTKTVT
jgi:hypothetical protein